MESLCNGSNKRILLPYSVDSNFCIMPVWADRTASMRFPVSKGFLTKSAEVSRSRKTIILMHKLQALQRNLLDRLIKELCMSISLKAKNRCLHSFHASKRSFTKVHINSKIVLFHFILSYILF